MPRRGPIRVLPGWCLWSVAPSNPCADVDRWTRLLIRLWCCLTELCLTVLPGRLSQTAQDHRGDCVRICTFVVYVSYSVVASGNDRINRPAGDRSG